MTPLEIMLGIVIGLISGMLSGLFGVGGGIVMTPGLQVILGAAPIVALATPLPVILPTALTGALTYRRAGELDMRAAAWMIGPGVLSAIFGALLTDVVDTHFLLVVTAVLLAYQSAGILRGSRDRRGPTFVATPSMYIGVGLVAGFASGLLGIGGGLVMVPMLAGWLGMSLKRALGTSLLAIVALVIPGTITHAALGHIDWALFLVVTVGAVPGARLGATIALGAHERTLRVLVGGFLFVVAAAYGVSEAMELLGR
ncbi:MAG: sulfite exporter TauE/SafE family protein [Actinomycetota bacterium]|nr:sulfite exporter TauE/SafE family protein [Actinomycetota bacterium]MDH5312537.1 sulfite exporter TauE/SafE family protein [Actinomycetota bacterium]